MRDTTYIRIFNALADGNWHNKADFCRPFSQDDRRLREMKERGWIDYEDRIIRQDKQVLYTEYRLTRINETWWQYFKQFSLIKQEPSGQLSLVV
jgi:hypothetical protein